MISPPRGRDSMVFRDEEWRALVEQFRLSTREDEILRGIIKLFSALAVPTLVALLVVAAPAAAQHCGACDNVDDDNGYVAGHWAMAHWNTSGPADTPNDYHFGIEGGSCSAHHDWCESSGLAVAETVIEAVAGENAAYLSEVVTGSPAVIVKSRQAIQILGCDGVIIVGHVPVSEGLMARLQAAVADVAATQ